MKKAIWVVEALLPVVVILGLIGLRADSVHVGAQEAEACFRYGKTDVLQRLDGADLVELAAIVDGKRLYRDSPSCGFDEDVSVRFGAQTFCIARDPAGQGTVLCLPRNRSVFAVFSDITQDSGCKGLKTENRPLSSACLPVFRKNRGCMNFWRHMGSSSPACKQIDGFYFFSGLPPQET